MKVSGIGPFAKGIKGASKVPLVSSSTSGPQIDLTILTRNLNHCLNDFLGIKPGTPVTKETLDKIQEKFWSSPRGTQAIFNTKLWNALREPSSIFSETFQTHNTIQSKKQYRKPVIFSTNEGLGITLEAKETREGVTVTSFCIDPAGCSANVARALHNFGTEPVLVGSSSTASVGNIYLELLKKEGVDTSSLIDIQSDLRYFFCTMLNGKEYWIVSLQQCLTPKEIDRLTTKLLEACGRNKGQPLALATGQPIGAAKDYFVETIEKAQDKHYMFVIYDPKLQANIKDLFKAIVEKGPGMIKPNLGEFAELVGIDTEKLRQDRDLTIHTAQELIEKHGLKMIMVSLDKDGALLIDKKRVALATPPKVEVVSTVGCGDAGVAALIDKGRTRQYSFKNPSDYQFKELLRAFVAGGVAKVKKPGTNLPTIDEVKEVEKEVKVSFV